MQMTPFKMADEISKNLAALRDVTNEEIGERIFNNSENVPTSIPIHILF